MGDREIQQEAAVAAEKQTNNNNNNKKSWHLHWSFHAAIQLDEVVSLNIQLMAAGGWLFPLPPSRIPAAILLPSRSVVNHLRRRGASFYYYFFKSNRIELNRSKSPIKWGKKPIE